MSSMKRFLVASLVVVSLTSTSALGQDSTVTRSSLAQWAGIYVHVLEHMMHQGRHYSNVYKDQRNSSMQSKFRVHSDRFNVLANRIRHEVQMALANKVQIRVVTNSFKNITREIERAEQEGRNLPYHESFAYMLEEAVYARGLLNAMFEKPFSDTTNGREWLCTATDRGGEEHIAQHMGLHLERAKSEQAAMQDCQEMHGNCRILTCRQVF